MTNASKLRKRRRRTHRKLARLHGVIGPITARSIRWAIHRWDRKRRELLDWITNIDPMDHPLIRMMNERKAGTIYHEWVTDMLPAAGPDEGADFR